MPLILTPAWSNRLPKNDKDNIEAIVSEQEDSEVSLRGYDILSYPADYTLEVLVGKWNKHEIRIPRLQRRFWTCPHF
jgi:hypothetical protein